MRVKESGCNNPRRRNNGQEPSRNQWGRRAAETTKAYGAILAYVALALADPSRGAARQYHSESTAKREISSVEDTKLRTWEGWSSKNAWVSRANARDEWIARTSDDQIIINILACKLPRYRLRGMRRDGSEAWRPRRLPFADLLGGSVNLDLARDRATAFLAGLSFMIYLHELAACSNSSSRVLSRSCAHHILV